MLEQILDSNKGREELSNDIVFFEYFETNL